MADAPENLKEAQKTESRSIEEPKIRTPDRRLDARKRGRTQDLGQRESGRRSDWRHETESSSWAENRETKDSGLKINERGQIHDNKESDADIRENLRRSSHETESRFLQHKNRDTDRRFDERIESNYPVRPGERDCMYYIKTGLCGFVRHCVLNHPRCKYFMRGDCKNGSACQIIHPKNMDQRVSEPNRRFEERIREMESSSRAKPNPDLRERLEDLEEGEILREQEKRYNKDISEIHDGIVAAGAFLDKCRRSKCQDPKMF